MIIVLLQYSALIWQSFVLAIGDLRSKSPLLKPPITNVHAHSNTSVHQVAKLKSTNYIFMEKLHAANIKRYTILRKRCHLHARFFSCHY